MPRFIIERAIPEIGSADRAALAAAAQKSNGVLAEMTANSIVSSGMIIGRQRDESVNVPMGQRDNDFCKSILSGYETRHGLFVVDSWGVSVFKATRRRLFRYLTSDPVQHADHDGILRSAPR